MKNQTSVSMLGLRDKALIAEFAEASAWADYLNAAPPDLAEKLNIKTTVIGGSVVLCAPGTADPFYNRVIGLGVREPATPELIDEILIFLGENGTTKAYIQVCPAVNPVETLTWIEQRGFFPDGSWVKLMRGNKMPPYIETGLDIRLVDASQAGLFVEIIQEVFGYHENSIGILERIVGRPNWRHYIAYDHGYPAAAAAMFSHGDIAWLGFMGTRESHRGRGAQNALVTRRIYDALQQGCKWIVSDTREHEAETPNRSLRNLEKLGFEVAYWRINFLNF